jgi:cytochrome c-type biogenesis protein CcmH
MRRLVLSLLFLTALVTGGAFAVPVADTFSSSAMEARARTLQRELRCLVCQGESIDESQAPLAGELRHLVRQQIAEGKSDSDIKQYLVARYGDFILMEPPLQPDTYFLWLAPFAILLGAGTIAWWVIRRAKPADSTIL